MEEIIESWANGQGTQVVEQIDRYGVSYFLLELDEMEMAPEEKIEILSFYIRRKSWK